MSTPTYVDYALIEPRPWKNGLGVTRPVFDDADAAGAWTWRVSIAELSGTQPYSSYPGVRRDQVALGTGGVDLTINGRALHLAPEQIVTFDGEDDVSARPNHDGFLDLNVMTRRDSWSVDIELSDAPAVTSGDRSTVVLVALRDDCVVNGHTRNRLDAALLRPGGSLALRGLFVRARLTPIAF
ncbi:HutD family protein [Microbacterium sp. ASV49]|uniref:HutD family protein n=1 Tax=Microbacterium candidum TaxID=3041922 RepID=A0ABT7N008_9MICO|nr:HutD family protein [Microbacterium sp. ASV49]MDL9980038.1 HutD family protein [Microbacterium sp. ASV49]